jgi:tetratricopeptide (TPR) repeat protein
MTQRSGLFLPAALAALFVVPAVALQDGSASSLEDSLRRTVLALEALAGLGERIEGGEQEAVGQLLAATEAPLDDEAQASQALSQLRGEVAALEIELDALHAAVPGALPGHTGARPVDERGLPLIPTVGLDDQARALLGAAAGSASDGSATAPVAGGAAGTGAGQPAGAARPKRSFEEPGYTADPLRLAKALYRQGRWEQALSVLDGRATQPEAAYWRARCLDKLGRFDEAAAGYEALVADPEGGEHARRAREDLEFLRWRREFEQRQETARGQSAGQEPGLEERLR